jgi:hypothetical protein
MTLFSRPSELETAVTVIHQITRAHRHLSNVTLLIQTRILPWNIDGWLVDTDGMKAHQSPLTILLFHHLIMVLTMMTRETSSPWDEDLFQVMIFHIMKPLVSPQVPRIVRRPQVPILVYEESTDHLLVLSDSGVLTHFLNNCVNTQLNVPERGHMTMKMTHILPQIVTLRLT